MNTQCVHFVGRRRRLTDAWDPACVFDGPRHVRAGSPHRRCPGACHCPRHCYRHWALLIFVWARMWAQYVGVALQQNYYPNRPQCPYCWIVFFAHPHCDAEFAIYSVAAKLGAHSILIGMRVGDVDRGLSWSLAASISHSCSWADGQYQMASAHWA